jgi:hypothetical protein
MSACLSLPWTPQFTPDWIEKNNIDEIEYDACWAENEEKVSHDTFEEKSVDFSNTHTGRTVPSLKKGILKWDPYMDKVRIYLSWPSYESIEDFEAQDAQIEGLCEFILNGIERDGLYRWIQDIKLFKACYYSHDQSWYLSKANPDRFIEADRCTRITGNMSGLARPEWLNTYFYSDPRFKKADKQRLSNYLKSNNHKEYLKSEHFKEVNKKKAQRSRKNKISTPESREKTRIRVAKSRANKLK